MRKIKANSILAFSALFIPAGAAAIASASIAMGHLPFLGEFRPVATVACAVILFYAYNMVALRFFLRFFPLPEGDYAEGSRAEFIYNVYVLFYLSLFNSLLPTLLIPVPIMRSVYIALGARLGKNTYCAGVMLDPSLVRIGENSIVGFDAVICPHAVEGKRVSFARITIGNNVTIGMRSIIMAGVSIGDGAIVAAGALVTKNTKIGQREVWGGSPARLLKSLS